MRKGVAGRLAVLILVFLAVTQLPARADLLISEMCDPHLNYLTDRFIEIFNAGDDPVDLTGWRLVAVGNAADIFTWYLSGTIDPEEALVVGDQTTVVAFQVDFPSENWSNSNSTWNGKVGDGARLLDPSGVTIDYAVVNGTYFENCDYVRNYGVTAPNTSFVPAEWTATPVEYPTDGSPGEHSATPPIHAPTIAGIQTDPLIPLEGNAVDIQAEVTDELSEVVSVKVSWGMASTSLPNEIEMDLVSGSTYRTVSPIPSQSVGTTIYYQVEATNEIPGTATSEVLHYVLAGFVTIHEIQGETAISPYVGETVITAGIVTATFASGCTIQQASGPWDGVWVADVAGLGIGDSVTVRGVVDESTGRTTLSGAEILDVVADVRVMETAGVTAAQAASEAYEGVLVALNAVACTLQRMPGGEWEADDGTGPIRIDDLGYRFEPTLGTRYDVIGALNYADGAFRLEPRDDGDIVWAGDDAPPVIFDAWTPSATTIRILFSEPVDPESAADESHYGMEDLTIYDARRDSQYPDQVLLTVSAMAPGTATLSVDGVEDLYANAASGETFDLRIFLNNIPTGYYDSAAGLTGETLQAALHNIIKNHTICSYTFAWTAFYTADDKPNGKVWDIYSDVPYGVLPYEYTFGTDEGGAGGVEGTGYTREHSWPKSWFGGEVSPMYSDIFILFPADADVNGNRGSFPYGEVSAPTWTSLNGSEVGSCSYPGYTGFVFEPIDDYKGDLARVYFYMSTRYYGEDAGWPGSPMTDGAQLLPWALEMMLAWNDEDPVSAKEIERNSAIYGFQHNRNPFVDHPEFAHLVFGPAAAAGDPATIGELRLEPNLPNPFASSTTIRFVIPEPRDVRLAVCDINGRQVALLASGRYPAGEVSAVWDGRDAAGREAASGIYFALLRAGDLTTMRRMVRIR